MQGILTTEPIFAEASLITCRVPDMARMDKATWARAKVFP